MRTFEAELLFETGIFVDVYMNTGGRNYRATLRKSTGEWAVSCLKNLVVETTFMDYDLQDELIERARCLYAVYRMTGSTGKGVPSL